MKTLTLIIALTISGIIAAQSPNAFSYQGVARDASGNELNNQAISIRFDLHQISAGGTIIFAETHGATTNDLGLFSLEVGNGTPAVGSLSSVDWKSGPYFLEVSMDPTGGSTYTSIGTQQLLSVPYALYAAEDGDWVVNGSELHSDDKNIGIGITNPNERIHAHAPTGSSFAQFSVNNSGSTAFDGFQLGMDGAQQAYIRQRENLPIFFYTNDQLHMRLTETGRLGVGINTPGAVLDVGGSGTQYARVTSTSGSTNGIEFVRQGAGQDWRWTNSSGFFDLYNVTNDFASATTTDIVATFTTTGRLGIGTINPLTELHVVGTIRNSTLAGTGNRPVVANSSGDLLISAAPTTQYWASNGYAFNSSSSVFNYGSIAYNTSGTGSIWASVNLPQGATVTSFYINYGDISAIANLNVRLLRVNIPGNFIQSTMSDITSSGTPGASSPALTDFTITDGVIDNITSTYLIEVRPQPGTSWDFNRINIRNVRISYTLPN